MMHFTEQKKKGETELLFYKNSILIVLFAIFGMTACSSKSQGVSEKEYMRSNKASEKALDKLDKE